MSLKTREGDAHEFQSGHKIFSGSEPPTQELQKTLKDPIKVIRSPGPGKGDKPRSFSSLSDDEERGRKWCRSMGKHRYRNGSPVCTNCGQRCRHPKQVTPEGRYTTFRCLDCGHEGKVRRVVS